MKQLIFVKQNLDQIPLVVRRFLLKALVFFIAWKLLYHLFLVPLRIPDKQLTNITAHTTALFYSQVLRADAFVKEGRDVENTYYSSVLYIDGKRAVGIGDPCNGLELYVLYIGFLFCIPANTNRRLFYIISGIVGIYVLNTFRCASIAWLNLNYVSLVNFAHHYFFKIIIYAAVFATWVKYSKKYFASES